MPRLPVEFHEVSLAVPRGGGISLGLAGAPAGAAAAGLQQAGTSIAHGTATLAQVELEKAKYAAGTEAMDLFTNAAQRVEDLHLSLKTTPDADPATHVQRFETGFKQIAEEQLAKTDNPLVKQATRKLLDRLQLESTLQARKDANGIFLDREKASVAQTLENMAVEASRATTPQARDFYTGLAQGYLASKQGVLHATEIQRLGGQFQQRVAMDGVRAEIRADPFADVDERIGRLTPENQERMTAFQESRQKQWIARNDAYQKALDKQEEEQRQQLLTNAESLALKGQYTVQQLDQLRDERWVRKPDEYKRLYDIITAGPKEQASDPATLDRVIADTRSDVPRMSEATLNALHDAGKLNTKDWTGALDHRRTRMNYLEGRYNTDENRAKADQERDFSKAKSLGQAEFQIPALYDRLEGKKGKVWGDYLQELTIRTQRGENALAVAKEAIPRYKQILGQEAQQDMADTQRLLAPYQSPQELDAAYARREISRGEYEAKQRLFQNLKQALDAQNAVLGPSRPEPPKGQGIGQRLRGLLPSGKPPANLGRE